MSFAVGERVIVKSGPYQDQYGHVIAESQNWEVRRRYSVQMNQARYPEIIFYEDELWRPELSTASLSQEALWGY